MLGVRLICVGKLGEKFWAQAVKEYEKRLGAYCKLEIIELPEQRLPQTPSEGEIAQALDREAALIESRIWPGAAVIAMCVEGKPMSSEQLADYFSAPYGLGTSKICLLIGGSCGLSERVKQKAALRLSMSPMTFPHHLARVMVLETDIAARSISQRAASIISEERNGMTKEQIAAIAVVLLLGVVIFLCGCTVVSRNRRKSRQSRDRCQDRKNTLPDVRRRGESHGQAVGVSVVR